MDGWSVLREIRSMSAVPVIMLTIRNSTDDKVRGLTEGADDYVTKPFDLKEIDARIRAVMRRARAREDGPVLTAGPLGVDDEAKEVRLNGRVLSLSPKEYELLRLLASKPGRVFSTQEILQAVWPERALEGSAEDVKKYIYFLRNKLEAEGEDPGLIQTVRGFGYKLVVDRRRPAAELGPPCARPRPLTGGARRCPRPKAPHPPGCGPRTGRG